VDSPSRWTQVSTLHINNFWSDSRIRAQISTPRHNAFYKHRLPIILGFAIVKANSLSIIVQFENSVSPWLGRTLGLVAMFGIDH